MNDLNRMYDNVNKTELNRSEILANEIKDNVKYHLYDDGLMLR